MENKTNPMRTKFIKVAVSDELPKEDGFYFVYNGGHHAVFYSTLLGFNSCMMGNNNSAKIIHWLKEVPDHEAELLAELKNARGVIGKLKRSIAVHPDCTENSEFDDYSTIAQECEEEIETLIQKVKSDENTLRI